MAVQLKQHIELRGDNPLDAVIVGTRYKAYLVANLAFNDGAEVSAEHYNLHLAQVHGAIAFYLDNEEAIEQAKQASRELGRQLGARDIEDAIEEIRQRKKQNDTS